MSEFKTSREEEEILARLRKALRSTDPAPSDIAEFAKAAFAWRDIDAELAELDFDSIEENTLEGVRSTATGRMISFQAGQWMLDVEYDETAGRLMGHISPTASFTVELHTSGALFSVESDEHGRFEADGVAPGPLSMVLRFSDGSIVKTQWVIL